MKFPKVLYVKMEKDGDITYPVPGESLLDIAEKGKAVQIGIYELREMFYAECEVKTSGTAKKRFWSQDVELSVPPAHKKTMTDNGKIPSHSRSPTAA